jgi:hypothetical protein
MLHIGVLDIWFSLVGVVSGCVPLGACFVAFAAPQLYDIYNNPAESYNSIIINKFVGDKRIHFSLKRSFLRR